MNSCFAACLPGEMNSGPGEIVVLLTPNRNLSIWFYLCCVAVDTKVADSKSLKKELSKHLNSDYYVRTITTV